MKLDIAGLCKRLQVVQCRNPNAEPSGRRSHCVKIGCEVILITCYYFWKPSWIRIKWWSCMHACSHIHSQPQICSQKFSPVCLANRSYYRCTNPRCNAKKQVERSTEDPEMLIMTYEGLHLHYAYSHFFLPRRQGNSATSLHVPKKPKLQQVEDLDQNVNPDVRPAKPEAPTSTRQQQQQQQQLEIIGDQKSPQKRLLGDAPPPSPVLGEERMPTEDSAQCPQGLLEDIVPLLVRNPCNSTSSQASSPEHYSSSHSWPPKSVHLDVGILSNMI